METTDPILGNPLFVAALLLFLIILPLALRQKKKTGLDKIIARMEAEESKEATKEETEKEEAGKQKDVGKNVPEKSPVLTDQPSPPPTTIKIPPAPKKKKKVVKESLSIAHNEENTGLHKAGSGSTASSRDKKSSNEDSGNNWVEAEIPGLIIEPFPADKDSDTEPDAKSPAPAEKKASGKPKPAPARKKSPDKPKPKEILTFKAASKSKHKFGEDEFEEFPSEKNLPSKVKDSAPKAVEKKETRPPEPEEIPELEPKDVEIKAIVVSHKDIAKKVDSGEKSPAPSAGEESTSGIEEPLELEAEIEAIPPEIEDREPAPYRPNPKPFFLDLKYLAEDEPEAAGPESSKKLSPGMVDRIVARLNELQNHLEHQLVSQPGKGGPAKRDMRHARIQDAAPEVAGTSEGLSEKKEVSLEELDGFLFTANRKKSQE
ncbi:MAG: hypothetical protein E2O43_07325 [Nitrospina sp.]|nr:MAG: hypothetical protein E2O43_07325 [Nitrospina sp.]